MTLKHIWKALVALTLIVASLCMLPSRTSACGPFFQDAFFVFSKHPDFPLEQYAGGKLGVIQPSWARSYLVVAYRNLSASPLSEREASDMISLWKDRLNLSDSYSGNEDVAPTSWMDARKKVSGAPELKEVRVYRFREKPHEYEAFLNCQQEAFTTATATLDERIKIYGADNPKVREWLTAQDVVFENCYKGTGLPEQTNDKDPMVRADRAYQTAAANFYATNFDLAKQQFDAIAKDKNSPYRIVAPYLAARALLRKGSLAETPEDSKPSLAEAEERLNAILKDSSLKFAHHGAARLLNLTRVRFRPQDKAHELAQQIVKKDSLDDFKQGVWDYTYLLDKLIGEDEEGKKPSVPAGMTADDLTDWIIAIQSEDPNMGAHSRERWEKAKSLPWLVAAVLNASGKDARVNDLLSAAANVNGPSPAFTTVTFHRARLLKEAGRVDEARAVLDQVLAGDRKQIPASAVNLLLGQRMMTAKSLNDFLQDAQREAAGFSANEDDREVPIDAKEAEELAKGAKVFFDVDAANVFNRVMPAAIMKDAARLQVLPPNLRKDVATAAFARAALVNDNESASQAASVMQEYYPQMKEFVTAYQRATTPEARRFAAAFLSLKFPGVRPFVSAGLGRTSPIDDIDSYRDNYWCAEPPVPQAVALASEDPVEANKKRPVAAPDFLKANQAVGARQFAAVQALGAAPNYLCKLAIEWANANPNDPRSPEALHLAVRSTRYGCTDKETGKWSKAAFDLLHKRYPNTKWANATKYWFNG
jgi:hypothetical protein